MHRFFTEAITYEMQIKQTQRDLKRQEHLLAQLQEKYLQKTKNCGNIIKGFQDYVLQKTLLVHNKQQQPIRAQDRIFSLSSVSSQPSKEYAKLLRKKAKKIGRLTRSNSVFPKKVAIKMEKSQLHESQMELEQNSDKQKEEIEELYSYDELSISPEYRRQGSLDKKPSLCKKSKKVKSEDNLSNTLSNRSPPNSDTQSLVSFTSNMKKKAKKPELSRSAKRWLNKEKKKAQISQTAQACRERPEAAFQQLQGLYTLSQIKTIPFLTKDAQVVKEEVSDQDSSDSAEQFRRLARKMRKL